MKIKLEEYKGSTYREQKALYIYFDHKFKVSQVVRPNMDKFSGDWKKLADSIAPNHYKIEIK